MMSGYPDARPAPPHRHRAYGVVARDGGWCVTLDDCATRPFKDREAALRIARQLQRQADGLHQTAPHA
ncbi:hypothetical protein [Brevundimonas sp. CEF1]|uniref:hypothetical protein n=1 Tax=Brevundimonas sp. CEF1 TaxID=3442642 RepID=UPI000FBA8375